MEKLRFHVVNLPHTSTTKEYVSCAYTQKVIKFCQMMMSLGHEVYLYGSEYNDAPCTEFITCIKKSFQPSGNHKKDLVNIQWNAQAPYWDIMNCNAINEIGARIQKKDFICLIGGHCQKPIADDFPNYHCVEFGIGYEGIFSKFRVFESYAWMHYIYGLIKQGNGSYYDAVIPNYFDPNDFPFSDKKEDYFLFVGRMISRKGLRVAVEACKHFDAKLIVAGQGVKSYSPGEIVTNEGTFTGNIEYAGVVDAKKRGELMSKARAVLVPTQYIGPFEGVHVEAMLCGTPVITSDWGVFSETVTEGIDGFRPRILGETIEAMGKVDSLNYKLIRERAVNRFSLDVVKYQYDTYFKRLLTLWGDGWYTIKK
jgi:glycosyltransferase involved in cell wall biosynthesis